MITLQLVNPPVAPLDLTGVTPDALHGLSADRIRRFKVPYQRSAVALGEFFAARGTPDTTLTLTGLTANVHGLGAGMRDGTLQLEGACGARLGAGMRGGTLQLAGNAGDFVGAGMRGGILRVDGSVGDFAGSCLPGATSGMKGGTLVVSRHAGARTGDRMRRGVIVVGGNTGPGCASQMLAGTLVALGEVGAGCALGMRRGSLLLHAASFEAPPTFVLTGTYELPFLALLATHLGGIRPALATRLRAFNSVQRWVGDRGCDGLGEILVGDPGKHA